MPNNGETNTESVNSLLPDSSTPAENMPKSSAHPDIPFYIPFNPELELKTIRQRTPEEKLMSAEQREQSRAQRLTEYKENLVHQREGIAATLKSLYSYITQNPDASLRDMLFQVEKLAPVYRFTTVQMQMFGECLNEYREKHMLVNKYGALYPEDNDLYEALIGAQPRGKVEVVRGPMSLYLKCFDPDDYYFALNYRKHLGDAKKLGAYSKKSSSDGKVLSAVKIGELANLVAVGNESAHTATEYKQNELVEAEISLDSKSIILSTLASDLEITYTGRKGEGAWRLKILERDSSGRPAKVQVIRNSQTPLNKEDLLLDAIVIKGPIVQMQEVGTGNTGFVKVPLELQGECVGTLIMDGIQVWVGEEAGDFIHTKYRRSGLFKVHDQKMSEETRVHEEQHIFNDLFKPVESSVLIKEMVERGMAHAKTLDEAIYNITYARALDYRQLEIDPHARDEIIAYYAEGTHIPNILAHLQNEKGAYNYYGADKEYYSEYATALASMTLDYYSKELYSRYYGGGYPVDAENAKPLSTKHADKIEETVSEVFVQRYQADLKQWVEAVGSLEKKGYSRDEILRFMYQEPINKWPKLFSRLPDKTSKQSHSNNL